MFGATEPWAGPSRRELFGLAALLLLGALLLGRRLAVPSLEFDEGVYLLSADLLTRGYELGRDVFTSQPPLFLALLDAANGLAGGDAALLRGLGVLIALGGALAGWAIVRRLAGPLPALAAVLLVVLAPGVVDAAAVVSGGVPSVALGTAAMLAARAARARAGWAAVSGGLLACALLVKLLAAPFAVAIAVGALVDRPSRRALLWFAAGSAVVTAAALLPYLDVIGPIWDGAIGLHLDAQGTVEVPTPSITAQVVLISAAYVGMLTILAIGVANVPRTERRAWIRDRSDLLAVLATGVALVSVQRPFLHHHLVVVAWPLALLAASALGPRPSRRALIVAGAAALLVVPFAIRGRDTAEGSYGARVAAAATIVRERTAPGAVVVSDLPLVPLLAGRQAPAQVADPSYVRVGSGSLSRDEILRAAARADAVVVGRSFELVDGLESRLAPRYRETVMAGGARIYLDPRGRAPRPS